MKMVLKFKILILLVALVALPLRGMAAVAMLHCPQDQHETAISADGHGDHHGMHGEQDAGHDHTFAVHGEPAESQGSPTASSCSACAACSVGGAAVPAAWTSFPLEPPGASLIAFAEQGFAGVVPAQLERPPLVRSL